MPEPRPPPRLWRRRPSHPGRAVGRSTASVRPNRSLSTSSPRSSRTPPPRCPRPAPRQRRPRAAYRGDREQEGQAEGDREQAERQPGANRRDETQRLRALDLGDAEGTEAPGDSPSREQERPKATNDDDEGPDEAAARCLHGLSLGRLRTDVNRWEPSIDRRAMFWLDRRATAWPARATGAVASPTEFRCRSRASA